MAPNALHLGFLYAILCVITRATRKLRRPIATVLVNTYRRPTELFVDGDTLLSQEGTTQGDRLAMPMYGLATIPLIRKLEGQYKQVWYANNSAAIGKIDHLRE